MKSHFKLLWVVLQHKYFVFKAGLKFNISLWRLIKHDLSKFSLTEFPAYARSFYGKRDRPDQFSKAWKHHQDKNDHHWEHWIKDDEPQEMPVQAAREMVADWIGAARAYTGNWPYLRTAWEWYRIKYPNIKLHPKTREFTDALLEKWFSQCTH